MPLRKICDTVADDEGDEDPGQEHLGEESDDSGSDGGEQGVRKSAADAAPAGDAALASPSAVAEYEEARAATIDEHLRRITILQEVIQQSGPLNNTGLDMNLRKALHDEVRRARGRLQQDPRVALALPTRAEQEVVEQRRQREALEELFEAGESAQAGQTAYGGCGRAAEKNAARSRSCQQRRCV